MTSEPSFDDLPTFDATKFEPPSWAKTQFHHWGEKKGESSNSNTGSRSDAEVPKPTSKEEFDDQFSRDEHERDEDHEGDEDIREDAKEDQIIEPDEAKFTTDELKGLLNLATKLKNEGNDLYKFNPPKYDQAILSYIKALDHLPFIPNPSVSDQEKEKNDEKKKEVGSGIEEVTDEEALKIQEEQEHDQSKNGISDEDQERLDVENDIKEMNKAVWGNLAACYIAIKDDKKAVEACSEALKIDPKYIKGLHRRATANERIGDLNALVAAKEDYTLLTTLLPPTSPLLPSIKRSLFTLPEQIKVEEKKQMDEMMAKLKDLGNSLLGNFGLSTDNFKFEKQENGGWGMQFQR
ncbi:hypothetical protein I204_08149 [Kwoniella mangroviensis CBS 8886]|uniref:uncharacterized protein n=1 Tax=Kwoniella mangroviensis CBS 8507 TaxID=1296122 RepID=UPI00080D5EEB|nr:uncharacterized protein I203_04491 [Kwoniella mangroviensis CBS 8507]OCF66165.1 hypothetical protein I203_04491 [Kwoniella mangroviensis CBS 8507]OCF71196.1 hypothetical protein I204_08149 [Kwoniella mangroviensis CBS 8886]